jgi:hypothetical protein
MEKYFLDYKVTDKGEVISPTTHRPMRVFKNKVTLGGRKNARQFSLPRLVYSLFVRHLEDHEQIKHIDGNKDNNILENLRVMSAQERGEALTKSRKKR